MKIGVFDSGVGGQSVATAINFAMPDVEVIVEQDHVNVPYGTKTEQQLYDLSLPILQKLADEDCQVIVVACNSVSTTVLPKLQLALPIPLIGVEPMIKEACQATKNKVVAVCATPRTLQSVRYKEMCASYAGDIVLIEPDCSEWAFMIEQDAVDRQRIEMVIKDALEQTADVVVLGCTHYHWIESLINSITKEKAIVLQPESQIIERLKQELVQLA